MNRNDVELVVRSVLREYGMRADIRRIALFARDWKIEFVDIDGVSKTVRACDSSPQVLRSSIISALELEVE